MDRSINKLFFSHLPNKNMRHLAVFCNFTVRELLQLLVLKHDPDGVSVISGLDRAFSGLASQIPEARLLTVPLKTLGTIRAYAIWGEVFPKFMENLPEVP